MTTAELDELAEEFIASQGGYPTFKGYRGYPAATCLSPNSMIVHGIPGVFELAEGDILSADVGVTLDGFVADCAYTFPVGEISPDAERLLEVGQAALAAGIEQCQAGNRLSDISHAVQQVDRGGRVLGRPQPGRPRGRSVDARGPADPELRPAGARPALAEGMTLAIEPMINAGGPDIVLHDDEWSISTADGSLSAHFEHTWP